MNDITYFNNDFIGINIGTPSRIWSQFPIRYYSDKYEFDYVTIWGIIGGKLNCRFSKYNFSPKSKSMMSIRYTKRDYAMITEDNLKLLYPDTFIQLMKKLTAAKLIYADC